MNEDIRQDTMAVLAKAKAAIEEHDEGLLADISDETIHNASIYQDKISLDTAIVMYALSKIVARLPDESTDLQRYLPSLDDAYKALRNQQQEDYLHIMHELAKEIEEHDRHIAKYVLDVMDQAKLKKSAKLYDHGISIAQSASTLGVSQWQLYDYIGKTRMNDGKGVSITNMKKRLQYTRKLFA